MTDHTVPEAWVAMPSSEQFNAARPPDPHGQRHPYDFGFFPAMGRLVMAHPGIAPAFGALFSQIMFAPGHLSRAEREMVAAVASAAQDCHYWTQSHAEFLRAESGSPELVEAIKRKRWRDVASLTPRERALCAIAEKLSALPTRIVEDDWRPLRDLGFDDRACLEVAHIVGIFNYLTRLADGLGLQLDPGTEEAARSGVALKRG